MLVLQRDARHDRDIVVKVGDEEILIRVCETRGARVRLGIIASKDVEIHRRETFEKAYHRPPRYVPTIEETRDAS